MADETASGTTDASIKTTVSEAHTYEGVYHKLVRLKSGELMVLGGETSDGLTADRINDLIVFSKSSEIIAPNGGRQQGYLWQKFNHIGPTLPNMFWWGIGDDPDIQESGGFVSLWPDRSPAGSTVISGAMSSPIVQSNVQNGRQAIRFSETIEGQRFLDGTAPFVINNNAPITIYTVCVPRNAIGGALFTVNGAGDTAPPCRSFLMFTSGGTQYGETDFNFNDDAFSSPVDYTNTPIVVAHYSDGSNAWCSVNGVDRPMTPNTVIAGSNRNKFWVGGMWMTGGLFQRGVDAFICEQIAYSANLRGTASDIQNLAYLTSAWAV